MIFDWLRLGGRSHEKTKVYGYTRSWSKMGSALSVVIASGLVFYSGNYSHIFWFSIIPYLFNIINFLGYPAILDGEQNHEFSVKAVWALLWKAFRQIVTQPPLRRLLGEGIGFETGFRTSKDYLQPILKQTAIALPLLLMLDAQKRVALLIGLVYFVLYLLSSMASRQAHRLVDWLGSEARATRFMWRVNGVLFICLVPSLWFKQYAFVIVAFIILTALQDLWRPLLVSRINASSSPEMGATILSIESQAKSGVTILLAPLLGWVVDRIHAFWPVGITGAVIATVFILSSVPASPHARSLPRTDGGDNPSSPL